MAYSSIKRKKCKCSEFCDKYPTLGWNGYFMGHAPQELKEKQTKKQVEKRNKANISKISRLVHEVANDTNSELSANHEPANNAHGIQWTWFLDRRNEMNGVCIECGKAINVKNDKYFHWSVAHIVPKALVPSQALNPLNWVELCWLHHQQYDSTFENAAKMMCFGEIKEKFKLFKDVIPAHELRKVNPYLLTD